MTRKRLSAKTPRKSVSLQYDEREPEGGGINIGDRSGDVWTWTLDRKQLSRLLIGLDANPGGTLPELRDRLSRAMQRMHNPNITWTQADHRRHSVPIDVDAIVIDNSSSQVEENKIEQVREDERGSQPTHSASAPRGATAQGAGDQGTPRATQRVGWGNAAVYEQHTSTPSASRLPAPTHLEADL
ncbi:hypothetical protein PV328_012347, partial [Microctonus aethiopoides]